MSFSKYLPKTHNLLALLVLCGAVFGMIGWILQMPGVIRLHPSFTPMVFNASLLLAFVSLGIFFSDRDYFKIGRICALVVLLFSAVTFLQYPLNFNSGLDTFFVKTFEVTKYPYPGRMAASTCIALFLLALGVFFNKSTPLCQFVRVICAAIVCCAGVVGVAGHIFQFNSQYGWGSFARMSIQTSICVIVLAVALLLQLRGRLMQMGFTPSRLRPFYVLIIGVFVTVDLMQLLLIKDYQKNRAITEIRMSAILSNFDATFDPLSRGLNRMAKRFAAGEYKNSESWEIDAESYFQDFTGIRRINWIEKNLVIKWAYPMSNGGAKIIGLDMRKEPNLAIVEQAIADNKPALSNSVPLRTGGDGLLFYYPVFRGKQLLGLLSVALEVDNFFGRVANAPGYFLEIRSDDGHELLNTGNAGPLYANDWGHKARYRVLNSNWDFLLTPTPAVVQSSSSYLPGVIGVCGISVTILLALSFLYFQRARDSEKRMKELFDWHKAGRDSISLMMLQLDPAGIVSSVNRATELLLDFKEEDLVGRPVFLLADYSEFLMYRSRVEEKLQRPLKTAQEYLEGIFELGEDASFERTFYSKTGRPHNVVLSLHRVVNEIEEVTGYLVIAEDVTQKKERERQMKEQEEKIMVSSRLASLGEMAAGIAHEINNPLAVMGGYISVIRKNLDSKGLGNDVDLNRRIDSVESMVQRIAKIVKGLRSYSHGSELGDLEEVDVAGIIDDTLAFCHEKFKLNNIQLTASIEPGVTVRCRPYQISQVLLNLLNNAFDAVESTASKRVRITAFYNQGGLEISVSDSGPGVPAELRERIMQPFFTTKEVGKGVGLGLSISMGIVQAHHGNFFLDGTSKETKFTIWLPHSPQIDA